MKKKTKNNLLKTILVGIIILCIFSFGIITHIIYKEISNQRYFDGLYLRADNYSEAKQYAKDADSGTWVCINTKGMSPQDCERTAKHECGHEVFANYCEDNLEKCLEVAEK